MPKKEFIWYKYLRTVFIRLCCYGKGCEDFFVSLSINKTRASMGDKLKYVILKNFFGSIQRNNFNFFNMAFFGVPNNLIFFLYLYKLTRLPFIWVAKKSPLSQSINATSTLLGCIPCEKG
jgi:hypothetical protein